MDIILVPGFWLDASSWSEVTPPLDAAGHRTIPLTLPGLESQDAPRPGIGLRDHINAVVAVVDSIDQPVVLVGHSGGGAIIAEGTPEDIAGVEHSYTGQFLAKMLANHTKREAVAV